MWTIVRLVCSTVALVAFSIRLSEEDEQEHPNPLLRAALLELVAFEGDQMRKRVEELCRG